MFESANIYPPRRSNMQRPLRHCRATGRSTQMERCATPSRHTGHRAARSKAGDHQVATISTTPGRLRFFAIR